MNMQDQHEYGLNIDFNIAGVSKAVLKVKNCKVP